MKDRKSENQYTKYIQNLRVLDDVFFEEYIKDIGACEELIQTVLENPRIRIKQDTLNPQKSIHIVGKRSVRVDAYVEGEDSEIYNIEIQRSDNCNHVKRVRYNASALTVNGSEPGDNFGDVRNVIVIYISEFDIFGLGKTVYHTYTAIEETSTVVNDGFLAVYVNTENPDGSKISNLMQLFKKENFSDNEFPKSSARMKFLKDDERQEQTMNRTLDKLIHDVRIDETIETLLFVSMSKNDIIENLTKKYKIDIPTAEAYYNKYMTQVGQSVSTNA